jgi:ABC-2 type transport system ATP-binding protein
MGTRQIKDLLVELGKRGKTILLCSHLLAEVEDICDRIGIMYGGRMQVEGSVKDLLELTGKTQIQTVRLNESVLAKIQTMLRQECCEFEITHPMDRLETFFVRTVNKAQREQQATSGAQAGSGISGFLAEREIVRQSGILDKLVAAKTETRPDTVQGDTETVAVTSQKAEPQENAELLRKLAAAKTDVVAETARPQQVKPVEAVKKDILSRLVGKDKNAADGATTPTDSKAAGE